MKYWFDTEFIENGFTIDLISIGIVDDIGRAYYAQNLDCKFKQAGDWVIRNVFPRLQHFDMRGHRSCGERVQLSGEPFLPNCYDDSGAEKCPWKRQYQIRDEVREFMDVGRHGKPEIWGYYADYDWVAFCQLFGAMIELPKGFPMFCRDLIQLTKSVGNPVLPKQQSPEHHALHDALWTRDAYNNVVSLIESGACKFIVPERSKNP